MKNNMSSFWKADYWKVEDRIFERLRYYKKKIIRRKIVVK